VEDDTPIDEMMFEIEIGICERFPALSPLSMRRERVNDVFRLISQYSNYARKNTNSNGKQVIRRRAGDDWF
jgi:hypothetical protein